MLQVAKIMTIVSGAFLSSAVFLMLKNRKGERLISNYTVKLKKPRDSSPDDFHIFI